MSNQRVTWITYDPKNPPTEGELPRGDYWLVIELTYLMAKPHLAIGSRERGKSHDVFCTADYGNCDTYVTHYAPFVKPELPK